MSHAIPHLINGRRTDGGTRTQPVYNPATGAVSGQVQLADALTVDAAIASAQAAFPAWRNTPPDPTWSTVFLQCCICTLM